MSRLDEEATKLVRLGCWEWLPGMPWRGRYVEDGSEARGRVLSTDDMDMVTGRDGWVLKPDNVDDCRPRLDDPAMEGLLLQLYRRAVGTDEAWVRPSGGKWWVEWNKWQPMVEPDVMHGGCGPSAVLALCDALGRV